MLTAFLHVAFLLTYFVAIRQRSALIFLGKDISAFKLYWILFSEFQEGEKHFLYCLVYAHVMWLKKVKLWLWKVNYCQPPLAPHIALHTHTHTHTPHLTLLFLPPTLHVQTKRHLKSLLYTWRTCTCTCTCTYWLKSTQINLLWATATSWFRITPWEPKLH